MRSMILGFAAVALMVGSSAQGIKAQENPVDVQTAASLMAQAKTLIAKAKASPDGLAVATLETYPNHLTMLIARVKDGGAEVHANVSDWLIIEDGEAVLMSGGKVIGGKETAPGETRGTKVEGGTAHPLHKGDAVHIVPGVPHQMLVRGAKPLIYYVVKVTSPGK
ncbi:MAG: hypothetical protein ABI197_01305 [Granulicella sp.]